MNEMLSAAARPWRRMTSWLAIFLLGMAFKQVSAAPADAAFRHDRKIAISAVRPSTGVATGAVIIYGHYVSPPYLFSYDGARLLLNGIQVEPSLVDERNIARFQAQREGKNWHRARFKEIEKEYSRLIASGATKQQVGNYVLAQSDLIEDARWESDTSMVATVKFPYGRRKRVLSRGIALKKKPEKTSPPKEAPLPDDQVSVTRQKEERMASLINALRGGLTLIFLSENGVYRTRQGPAALKQVLIDSKLDSKSKVKALKEILPASEAAAEDMVENFDPSEWDAIRTQ